MIRYLAYFLKQQYFYEVFIFEFEHLLLTQTVNNRLFASDLVIEKHLKRFLRLFDQEESNSFWD